MEEELVFWVFLVLGFFFSDRTFAERTIGSNIKKNTREKDKKKKAFNFYVVAFYCDQG